MATEEVGSAARAEVGAAEIQRTGRPAVIAEIAAWSLGFAIGDAYFGRSGVTMLGAEAAKS